MKSLPTYQALIDSFRKLPGVGARSAERMASNVLEMKEEDAFEFASAIENAKKSIHKCPNCGLYTEGDLCEICKDEQRDRSVCLVVASPKDALSFENVSGYNGTYHVLGGLISPKNGIGPEQLSVAELKDRIEKEGIKELIVATSPTLEGETTALFLAKIMEPQQVKVTRLAYGLPVGGSLEYTDALTLTRALEGRKTL